MIVFCRLHDGVSGQDVYAAFNAHDYFVKALIPLPPSGKQWFRVVSVSFFLSSSLVL